MTERIDAIIIGAGHNGLVCAGYLARAGMNVVCLESGSVAGGMSAPRTIAESYHFPGLAHAAYPVNAAIRRDLKLDRFGYVPGDAIDTVSLDADGQHLTIAANSIAGENITASDEQNYPVFRKQYLAFAKALRPLYENKPPRLKNMGFADTATLAKLGWNVRMGLGRETMYEFLRVAAINIYDVLNEEFDDDRLKGAIAADAVLGSAMGPRTPGTVLAWLQRLQGERNGPISLQSGGPVTISACAYTIRRGCRRNDPAQYTRCKYSYRERQNIWCEIVERRHGQSQYRHIKRRSTYDIFKTRRRAAARCDVRTSSDTDSRQWRSRKTSSGT